jgi:hypothetical protein
MYELKSTTNDRGGSDPKVPQINGLAEADEIPLREWRESLAWC